MKSGEGTQKIVLNLVVRDDDADATQDHLTNILSRLDSSLKITVKAQTERTIIARDIIGTTPLERMIDRSTLSA